MSLISRITTWTVNQILTSSALNGEFNNIVNLLNNIDAGTTNFTNCNSTSATITTATVTTLANTLQKYRRPVLQYNSSTVVNVETGINGTSGQLGIIFPDGTYRTDSTTTRIQCNLAQVAALTGTAQSGLRTGTVTNNTWYAIFAVKSQVNTTDIVVVADTTLPTQTNFASLNTNFGTSGWVFIGLIRYGDTLGTANAVVKFLQAGNMTLFQNTLSGAQELNMTGIYLGGASASSFTYTYSAGTGSTNIPNNVSMAMYGAAAAAGSTQTNITDSAGNLNYCEITGTNRVSGVFWMPATNGIKIANGSAVNMNACLMGFIDGALGVGSNPIL